MNIKQKFDLNVPDDLQIYESYIEPAGAYWKNPDTVKFIGSGKRLSLELEREPRNRHDPNAIKNHRRRQRLASQTPLPRRLRACR
jgi:hypothetical protein